ncbi:MAG: queuosine salvage family protein [Xenococcaceae cyanobacterium]
MYVSLVKLYQRFSTRNAGNFNFRDINSFTVVCDNVLPCILSALGVLIIPKELLQRLDSRQPLPAGYEEAELRATAITAVEIMIEEGKGAFWAKEIGDFLWTLGKETSYRSIERHATPDTCFY